jgi:hypothetical protein
MQLADAPAPVKQADSDAGAGAAALGQKISAWNSSATFAITDTHMQMHHGSMAEHVTIVRTSANDTARATRVMQASLKLLGPLTMHNTQGKSGPTDDHRVIPASVKAQWQAQYPDLPVPNLVVFDKASGKAVGALFVGGTKAKDLGMGTMHEHSAGGAIMQHMWFVPGDLQLAFSDTTRKAEAIKAAVAS